MRHHRIREIFRDTERLLLALETVAVNHGHSGVDCWCYAQIETIAVVVLHQKCAMAFDVEGNTISLDLLRKSIPTLDAAIPESYAGWGHPE